MIDASGADFRFAVGARLHAGRALTIFNLVRAAVTLTLTNGGDHRLSRSEDIERLLAAVGELFEPVRQQLDLV
jgi:hypothetical protein